MQRIGMEKWGATFVSPWHDHIAGFQFADGTDPSIPMAYQVRRSEFDEILFRRAKGVVAEARENCRVREVDLGERGTPPRVTATDRDGTTHEWRAKFIVDATGRDTFIANRLKVKRRIPEHNSSAMYGHFRNAVRDCGKDEPGSQGNEERDAAMFGSTRTHRHPRINSASAASSASI